MGSSKWIKEIIKYVNQYYTRFDYFFLSDKFTVSLGSNQFHEYISAKMQIHAIFLYNANTTKRQVKIKLLCI